MSYIYVLTLALSWDQVAVSLCNKGVHKAVFVGRKVGVCHGTAGRARSEGVDPFVSCYSLRLTRQSAASRRVAGSLAGGGGGGRGGGGGSRVTSRRAGHWSQTWWRLQVITGTCPFPAVTCPSWTYLGRKHYDQVDPS